MDTISHTNKKKDDTIQSGLSSLLTQAETVNTPARAAETPATLLSTPRNTNPPPPQAPVEEPAPSAAQTLSSSQTSAPPTGSASQSRGQRRGLYIALIALVIIVLGASGLAAFFIFSGRSHPQPSTPTTAIVGHGFFSSS